MTRFLRPAHRPALLVAAALLASTFLAAGLAEQGAWVLVGPALLAVTTVAADRYAAHLRGKSGPSPAAWLVGASILLASAIVWAKDPALVTSLLPVLGATTCVPLLGRSSTPCPVRRVSS